MGSTSVFTCAVAMVCDTTLVKNVFAWCFPFSPNVVANFFVSYNSQNCVGFYLSFLQIHGNNFFSLGIFFYFVKFDIS